MNNRFLFNYLIIIVFFFSCDYSGSSNEETEPSLVSLSIGQVTEEYIEILYSSNYLIAGFQFSVSGFEISGASGGAAGDAGFTVSTGSNMVLGFSIEGSTIPAGSGALTKLSYTEISSNICIGDIIISDPVGSELESNEIDCN